MFSQLLHQYYQAVTPDELLYPVAFYRGKSYFFDRANRWSASYFGGPAEVSFSGIQHGPRALHHVCALAGKDLPIGKFFLHLPLFYGFVFSGCDLRYRRVSVNEIEVLEITPSESLDNFPYANYPTLLPYLPLKIRRTESCTFKIFSELSVQPGWRVNADNLIVIVPPTPLLGASLWGPAGDAEGVQIVFECDVNNAVVHAFNQCG